MEGWFYGQYETGPWWASHSKVDDDNSNGDIVFATSERWLLKILKISTIQDGVPGIFDWVGAGVGMQGEDRFRIMECFVIYNLLLWSNL